MTLQADVHTYTWWMCVHVGVCTCEVEGEACGPGQVPGLLLPLKGSSWQSWSTLGPEAWDRHRACGHREIHAPGLHRPRAPWL